MAKVKKYSTVHGKRFVPTAAQRRKVISLAACGLPKHIICSHIINPSTKKPISEPILMDRFRDELDTCNEQLNAEVADNMFRYATTRNNQAVAAGKFWLTHKAGWKPAAPEAQDSSKITIEVINGLGK